MAAAFLLVADLLSAGPGSSSMVVLNEALVKTKTKVERLEDVRSKTLCRHAGVHMSCSMGWGWVTDSLHCASDVSLQTSMCVGKVSLLANVLLSHLARPRSTSAANGVYFWPVTWPGMVHTLSHVFGADMS